MLKFLLIAILFTFSHVFSQPLLSKYSETGNKIILQVELNSIPLLETDLKNKKIVQYGYFDESHPGEIPLPSQSIFVGIPAYSSPSLSYQILKQNVISSSIGLNPSVTKTNDTTLNYDFFPSPQKKQNKKEIEVKGFLWIGNIYAMHIKINQYSFDYSNYKMREIENIKIELTFKNNIIALQKESPLLQNSMWKSTLINFNQAKKFAVHKPKILANDSSGNWIDYNKTYIKIKTAENGIYRITYLDILTSGINPSQIDPLSVNLYNKGKKIPIYFSGEKDHSFDPNDYIEFIGRRNMGGNYREVSTTGEPYKTYLDRYSDTTVYWLTWNDINPVRVREEDSSGLVSNDTLTYYYQVTHYEKDIFIDFPTTDLVRSQLPYWLENKFWGWYALGVGTRNNTVNVNNIYPNHTANQYAKIVSFSSDIITGSHLLGLSLNDQTSGFDSVSVNRFEQKVLNTSINSNLLKDGDNNIVIHSYQTTASINSIYVDWYEIEYPRYLKLTDDNLVCGFSYLNSTGIHNLKILASPDTSYSIWKSGKEFKKYNNFSNINGEIVLSDTVSADDSFYVFSENKIKHPVLETAKQFVNLRSGSNQADYIAITSPDFMPTVNNYTNFIEQQYHLSAKAINIEDIYDEFSFGYFNPESIKSFLEAAHTYWKEPFAKYLFLIGKPNYDYHNAKYLYFGAPFVRDVVPSFGEPVSDTWFVIWDSTDSNIPQMDVGRLPAKNIEEVEHYFEKHKNYLSKNFDEWNKKYLFFSGGNFTDPSQINQLKNINDNIINSYIKPEPIGGEVTHFYKTVDPITNFGPYSNEEIQNAIGAGGILISYLGHSGTETWDNTITDPSQLKNNVDRNPLITDYGCSTAKFAEPDVVSFSELSVSGLDGQAIAYIANSSLGFTSTSYIFPDIFYNTIFKDSVYNLGDAHRLSKIKLMDSYGISGSYRLFVLENSLVGDPVINLPIPTKPNLSIQQKDFKILPLIPGDQDDSLTISFKYKNLGRVLNDSIIIEIKVSYSDSVEFEKLLNRSVPLYKDSIRFSIPIKGKPGNHTVTVSLDNGVNLDEISKADNNISFQINVLSSSLRNTSSYISENRSSGTVNFLNPSFKTLSQDILVEISNNGSFINPVSSTIPFDSFYTQFKTNLSFNNSRIWLRGKLSNENSFGPVQSFYINGMNGYILNDSTSFSTAELSKLKINNNKITADTNKIHFEVLSAGFNDGKTALITKDGQNYIPENTMRGHHICLFDAQTCNFIQYQNFDTYSGGSEITNYINFLDTLSDKYIIAIAVADEGRILDANLREKIKLIGSKYIDNLRYRGSWAIIGRKGAPPGSVPEAVSNAYQGRVTIDTTIAFSYGQGTMISSKIGPSTAWKTLSLSQSVPAGAEIKYKPVGIKNDGEPDTLNYLNVNNGTADLNFINAGVYPYLKILTEYSINKNSPSPEINSLAVNYTGVAELGTNYQVVSISSDSAEAGESTGLKLYVYNAGEAEADSFRVNIEVIKPDNSRTTILNQMVPKLGSEKKEFLQTDFINKGRGGRYSFHIVIDPENKIRELFKDNNIYDIPFYVKADTSTRSVTESSMVVKFDGKDILDGDFVSSDPDIIMELNYPVWFSVTDTTAVKFLMDDAVIPYSQLKIDYDTSSYHIFYNFRPVLINGEHSLKIFGKDITGRLEETPGYQKDFVTSEEAKILEVYNYPNPFKNGTYFTFKLTQVPDQLKIRIFTVAGRLVKEVTKNAGELQFDFNRIYWDGRDEDGSLLANGVYFYKITIVKGDTKVNAIQKIAIVR